MFEGTDSSKDDQHGPANLLGICKFCLSRLCQNKIQPSLFVVGDILKLPITDFKHLTTSITRYEIFTPLHAQRMKPVLSHLVGLY